MNDGAAALRTLLEELEAEYKRAQTEKYYQAALLPALRRALARLEADFEWEPPPEC